MDIVKHLGGHPWSDSIQYYDQVSSTNAMLQQQAMAGAPAGTVIIADSQTGGKGRLGRSFHSPAGSGIYMSVLLRPGCEPEKIMHLTCAVAVAACKAAENITGLRLQVKWVNDLVVQGKKAGGILTALSVDQKTGLVDWAIVGIGINCNTAAFPPELQEIATSLSTLSGHSIDREMLAAELVIQLHAMSEGLIRDQNAIMEDYRKRSAVIGQSVWLIRGDQRRNARILGIDDSGGLCVQLADGSREIINSGEISLRGENSYI